MQVTWVPSVSVRVCVTSACGCVYTSISGCLTPCECGPFLQSLALLWLFGCPSFLRKCHMACVWSTPAPPPTCTHLLVSWVASDRCLCCGSSSYLLWISLCRLTRLKGLAPEAVGASGHVCSLSGSPLNVDQIMKLGLPFQLSPN